MHAREACVRVCTRGCRFVGENNEAFHPLSLPQSQLGTAARSFSELFHAAWFEPTLSKHLFCVSQFSSLGNKPKSSMQILTLMSEAQAAALGAFAGVVNSSGLKASLGCSQGSMTKVVGDRVLFSDAKVVS